MKQQNILLVCRHAPYGSSKAQEALDLALAATTFDQNVSILFTNSGCLQLIKTQDAQQINAKDMSRMLSALPIYGVEQIFYVEDDARALGLQSEQIMPMAKPICEKAIGDLFDNAHHVFQF